jgi:glycerate kinase
MHIEPRIVARSLMKIVIAADKFKSCLSAAQVAQAMSEGVRRARPDASIDSCPMSDGGEGFVDSMTHALTGRVVTREVTGPLPEMKVAATFGIVGTVDSSTRGNEGATAIMEMSAASGLHLLKPDEHNPEATTTFGTGQLINAAIEEGCATIILGIGGSATIDGGIGCCQAVGMPVLLEAGEPTAHSEPLCGRDLERVVRIKTHRGDKLGGVRFVVACDVTNPLFGPNGAARIFGPQKGATPRQVEQFDRWLEQLAQRNGMENIAQRPGAGAAGGLGFAMTAFFNATMKPGAELVIEATHLRERLSGADLCITGEGRFDQSSLSGKAPARVAELCRELNVPCAAIVGSYDPATQSPFDSISAVRDEAASDEESKSRASELIAHKARVAVQAFLPKSA